MVEAPVLNGHEGAGVPASGERAAGSGRPLRLLVLTPKPMGLSPGQRFRLEQLACSRELRSRLGAAGRKTIEERYSAEVVAESFARAVRATLG